jgi:L-lactate dehydrogenase complex protein LldE
VRELRTSAGSERVGPAFNKPQQLLASLDGIEITELRRPDECCGFGGLFSVTEEAVSCMMGQDRIADHEQAGTEVLTSTDMSCLMHLDGLIRRHQKPMRVMHIAEVFAAALQARECESRLVG